MCIAFIDLALGRFAHEGEINKKAIRPKSSMVTSSSQKSRLLQTPMKSIDPSHSYHDAVIMVAILAIIVILLL